MLLAGIQAKFGAGSLDKTFGDDTMRASIRDCVVLGVYNWEKVDVVLSGINAGSNLGNSIWHSGTVAAAKQATLLGLRGIAMSMPATEEANFEVLKPSVEKVLEILFKDPPLALVNVNFPEQQVKGLR